MYYSLGRAQNPTGLKQEGRGMMACTFEVFRGWRQDQGTNRTGLAWFKIYARTKGWRAVGFLKIRLHEHSAKEKGER